MAIPTETSMGTIVTTLDAGRIVEYDPSNGQWIKNLPTLTPNPHIVAGVEDDSQNMWFTEYSVNKLAKLNLNTGVLTEVTIPGGGGPAFPAWSSGKVWFSLWTIPRMGAYDPVGGGFTFYDFFGAETGGPFFAAPNGDIACGTKGTGYVMVWHHQTGIVDAYPIPTAFPGLKDGLTVAADGAVWITESGANKIARLRYPH